MKIACVRIQHNVVRSPEITHEVSFHYGYDISTPYVVVSASRLIFKTVSDYETFVEKINTWQTANTITLSIQRKSTGEFLKLDGTNTDFPVLMKNGLVGNEKLTPGDGQYYTTEKVIFEQNGDGST